jgi:hypothetical protein
LELLEDRLTPAVTATLNGTILDVTLGTANDTAMLTGTTTAGTDIQVTGSAISPTAFSGVTAIQIANSGANAGQSVALTASGSNRIMISGGIDIRGVESITLETNTTLQADSFSESGATAGVLLDTVGVATAADQAYADPVTLGVDTTLSAANITFGGTVDSDATVTPRSRIVDDTGVTTFNGFVGTTAALASLTTGMGAKTDLNASFVTTTGDQAYNGPVVLGSLISDLISNSGAVRFGDRVDGLSNLQISAGSSITFDSFVGATTPLASLTTMPGTATDLNAGSVETLADQAYDGAVVLGGPSSKLTSDGGSVAFSGTLNGASDLQVTASDLVTFAGFVGAATPLTSMITSAGGATDLYTAFVVTSGDQMYQGDVMLGGPISDLISNSGAVTFDGSVNGLSNLHISAAGSIAFDGTVGTGTPLVSLTTSAGGTTDLNAGIIHTIGEQTYDPIFPR